MPLNEDHSLVLETVCPGCRVHHNQTLDWRTAHRLADEKTGEIRYWCDACWEVRLKNLPHVQYDNLPK